LKRHRSSSKTARDRSIDVTFAERIYEPPTAIVYEPGIKVRRNLFRHFKKAVAITAIAALGYIGTEYIRHRENALRQQNHMLMTLVERLLPENTSEAHPPPELNQLGLSKGEYAIEISKDEQRFRIWQRTDYALLADEPCTTGENPGDKQKQGDRKTPTGPFTITAQEDSRRWLHEGEAGAYGPMFFRLDYGSWDRNGNHHNGRCSIGIHGTNEEELLGTRASAGCVRLSNESLTQAHNNGYLTVGNRGIIRGD